MAGRKRSNPLALAVLACLFERPMHPYEMASTLRSRGKEESIKLNYGSLYTVVESLQRQGLIEPQEVERAGRRPERTVYALTNAGRVEFVDWLSELIGTPVKEYFQFEAGLSLMPGLPPEDVLALLAQRCIRLQLEIARVNSGLDLLKSHGLPRLFGVESEYRIAMLRAELAYTQGLMDDIESGELGFISQWASWHCSTPHPRRPLHPAVQLADMARTTDGPPPSLPSVLPSSSVFWRTTEQSRNGDSGFPE